MDLEAVQHYFITVTIYKFISSLKCKLMTKLIFTVSGRQPALILSVLKSSCLS